ncbi:MULTISPECIES: SDR family oxidoreductase [Metallosphaera]|uniref:Short-chain dehydrogenase/reductase SDR n=3 Tax=Metallosphaera TaxID=41980 RepID=A4YIG0_METS5|nr:MULTISPECIES: SDR family oxidoreductase [Metallosphaera]ABP96212.1 short-chain dehydrogenase/reductase SDR [Metallosphaera sedula DSM 5348]AIM28195.1 short-chain dehydrogenase/reductase SDR [Metallosphaera sedula]AKV75010.1 short-chain dehydrogenase [Metallosphaera sedula]AKV77248.1 short-chain dehydrogenase [Metallosphaera sedula]AKV79498.1 short-chain dehydrogenase [Metallosphaera sedula]
MDLGIRGKRVLVTASSKGIGFATAKRFLEEGAVVTISSHNLETLKSAYEKLRNLGQVYMVQADLTKPDEARELVKMAHDTMNGLDVTVYVTGSPKPGNLLELTDKDWMDAFNLLLMSAVVVTRESAKYMKPGGRIILSTSMTLKQPIDNLDLSNVVRLSLAGLIKSASRELGLKGILVNGVMPGWTLTERVNQLARDRARREGKTEEQVISEIVKEVPLNRIGLPEEVANVILFLSSSLSTYVTGTLIPVDGGLIRTTL